MGFRYNVNVKIVRACTILNFQANFVKQTSVEEKLRFRKLCFWEGIKDFMIKINFFFFIKGLFKAGQKCPAFAYTISRRGGAASTP